jgi:Mn-containing catalase
LPALQTGPERLEEFAPGLDDELLQLNQATADTETADIDATSGPMTTKE